MSHTIHTIHLAMPLRMGFVNCYLIDTGSSFFLVDTGSKNKRLDLENELERHGCRPGNLKLIVLTHSDFDHTGNAAHLAHKFDTRTLMHSADAPMVEQGDMFVDRGKVNPLMCKLVAWMTGFGKKERFTSYNKLM